MPKDLRQTIELQLGWWERSNPQPLVCTYAPVDYPFSGFDMDVSPQRIVEKKRGNLEAESIVPADNLAVTFVDFGTAFLPALGGAGFEYDGVTSWSIPCASSAAELKITPFDESHPLWRQYIERFEVLLANWSWDTFVPGVTVMTGPMDILSGMLGPETLAMELVLDPDSVQAAASDAAQLFNDVFDVQKKMLRDAGLAGGMGDWMHTWLPGDGVCFSEDFAALCGEQHFREFFTAADRMVADRLDSAYLHVHSAAIACLPAILEIDSLRAIELSNDPNGPALDRYIAAAQQIQASGRPMQTSNWQHPLTDDEITSLVGSLDPRGLKVTLQAASLDEAHRLYELAKSASPTLQ